MSQRLLLSTSFAVVAILIPAGLPASDYSFQGLGDLVGGTFSSRALGVSGDGSVVVGRGFSPAGQEAFRWTQAGGMVGLGDLSGGSFSSVAWGVSADGSVVVGRGNSVSGNEAYRWTQSGGMVGLGDLPGGGFNSRAFSVSGDGSVVVGMAYSSSTIAEVFRWTESSGMVDIGSDSSLTLAVSADGSVIVLTDYIVASGGYEAFRWTESGGRIGLGELPGGTFSSDAWGVSADGSVIVGNSTSASGLEAFRWTQSGGMIGLGDLPGGVFASYATSISADGSVIVGGGSSASDAEAFLWNSVIGMQSLRDLLIAGGVSGLEGWALTEANAISGDGHTIVGYGINPLGQNEAWIARLEELPKSGDANSDGLTDGADYTVWADNFLRTNAPFWDGDFTGDRVVDGADYTVWADHFAPAQLSLAAVPEPSTFALAGIGTLALGAAGARRAFDARNHGGPVGLTVGFWRIRKPGRSPVCSNRRAALVNPPRTSAAFFCAPSERTRQAVPPL